MKNAIDEIEAQVHFRAMRRYILKPDSEMALLLYVCISIGSPPAAEMI